MDFIEKQSRYSATHPEWGPGTLTTYKTGKTVSIRFFPTNCSLGLKYLKASSLEDGDKFLSIEGFEVGNSLGGIFFVKEMTQVIILRQMPRIHKEDGSFMYRFAFRFAHREESFEWSTTTKNKWWKAFGEEFPGVKIHWSLKDYYQWVDDEQEKAKAKRLASISS
jgi:hypothetical protein